jgi:hypothetical protein
MTPQADVDTKPCFPRQPSDDWAFYLEDQADAAPPAFIPSYAAELEQSFQWLLTLVDDCDPGKRATPRPGISFELEDRRLEITNFDPDRTTEDKLTAEGSRYGEIEFVDMSERMFGKLFVKFYDLRSAYKMKSARVVIGNHRWLIQYAPPEVIVDRKHPPNTGTIVLFADHPDIPREVFYAEFTQYGEIREIRSAVSQYGKGKKVKVTYQYFVEFWDIRASQRAFERAKARGYFGRQIPVEFSRPGGYRKNPTPFMANRIPTVARKSMKQQNAIAIVTPERNWCAGVTM